eukprot:CAMPEP_0203765674 /NCGR_PEP_ID=MMETSP0098-20131031/18541_1 /ASSEMBLY_ACC=CAM_ASM_000208 /TAXON_ID=96639 /ORGANISM=" , Strain NY0313808BC1" /LENGTH=1308 /DNA_ID=CAMNT_0050661949 /DNA_START=1154 /DNA_END=5080 /DNA_ORIENTATION=-
MVLFQSSARTLFLDEDGKARIQTILRCVNYIANDDFELHREANCLFCMVSTKERGARAIMGCDGSLGYIVQILHSSTSAASKMTAEQVSMCDGDAALALSVSEDGQDGGKGNRLQPSQGDVKPPSPPHHHQQGSGDILSMDSINTTARNAVTAGSQLFNNFIRRNQTDMPAGSEGSTSQGNGAKPVRLESKLGDARRVACWSAMLLNNLCVYSHNDVQMRMVISQAYETSNAALGSSFDRAIFQRVLLAMRQVCSKEAEGEKDSQLLLLPESTDPAKTTVLEQVVNYIFCGGNEDGDDAYSGRSVLMNLDFLHAKYPEVTLGGLLNALLQRFTGLLTDSNGDLPPVLPVSTEASRGLSFVLMILTHPVLQKRLSMDSEAMAAIVGTKGDTDALSFVGIIRSMNFPEYSGVIDRSFQALLNERTGQLKMIPMLPYKSFQGKQGVLRRLQSFESASPAGATYASKTVSSPSPQSPSAAASSMSPTKDSRPIPPQSPSPPPRIPLSKVDVKTTRSSIGGGSPTSRIASFGSKSPSSQSSPKTSGKKGSRRGSNNPYMPSHSNLILSPLLHDMNAKSLVRNQDGQKQMPASSEMQLSSSPEGGDSFPLADGPAFNLLDWHTKPDVIAIQISLRMERMYMATDPCRILLLANCPSETRQQVCFAECRFLDEYEKIVYFFKTQVLGGETSAVRARIIECIIDMAHCAASATLRNAALVLACIEALQCPPIRRLELTWRNVVTSKWQVFDELKQLCAYNDNKPAGKILESPKSASGVGESQDDKRYVVPIGPNPTVFVGASRIPYLHGIVNALRFSSRNAHIKEDLSNIVNSSQSAKSLGILEENMDDIKISSEDNVQALDVSLREFDDKVSTDCEKPVPGKPGSETQDSESTRSITRRSNSGDYDPLGLFNEDNGSVGGGSQTLIPTVDALNAPVLDEVLEEERLVDFEVLRTQYHVASKWIPTIRGNGDWFQRLYPHEPNVQLQILLRSLPARPPKEVESEMQELSLRQEPSWSLDQMLLESLYAIEGWIESLFESDSEQEGQVIRTFRLKVRAEAKAHNLKRGITSSGGSSGEKNSWFRGGATKDEEASMLDTMRKIPAKATGRLIDSLVKKITGTRKERLLIESGSRSAEHWDRIVERVRLCVERVVLAPVFSRLLLGAMRDHISKECELQERILILRGVPVKRLIEILGLAKRNGLNECLWYGAVATLKSFDDVDMPSLKLKILLRLKDEIYREASERGILDMNADEFLPVMTFIIVQAQLKHAYASTMLLRELLSDEFVSGEAAYYLTTFEIALGHLSSLPLPEDILPQ